MPQSITTTKGFAELSRALAQLKTDERLGRIESQKRLVLDEFQRLFTLDGLRREDFKERFIDFLKQSKNMHWSGLSRKGQKATTDMTRLQKALAILLNENSSPIGARLDEIRPKKGAPLVANINKAVLTAILQVAYPDKYGVWNGTSERGLKGLGLWPKFQTGTSFGQRYKLVNDLLRDLATNLGVDLWTLDVLWWRVRDVSHEARLAAEIAEEEVEGFTSSPQIRKAVEDRAMDVAIEHYMAEKFTVDSQKHKTEPYDLECVKGGTTLHVEVKGTQGSGKKIILTDGEVEHAGSPGVGVQMELCVVHGIKVTKNKVAKNGLSADSGMLTRFSDWNPKHPQHKLTCITYRCELGVTGGERVS